MVGGGAVFGASCDCKKCMCGCARLGDGRRAARRYGTWVRKRMVLLVTISNILGALIRVVYGSVAERSKALV